MARQSEDEIGKVGTSRNIGFIERRPIGREKGLLFAWLPSGLSGAFLLVVELIKAMMYVDMISRCTETKERRTTTI